MIAGLRRAGVAIGVCTNKPEDLARDVIDGLGLQVFIDHLVGGDTLPVKKPDPAPVLAVLRHLGVPPEAAVMVGDTDADIGAGEAAGMPTVGVTWGYGAVDGATMTIHGADELLPLLGLP
jgi:phosphoglycolate phosphatase